MFNISSFLARFQNFGLAEKEQISAIEHVVKKTLNLTTQNIKVRLDGATIIVLASAVIKNEIFFQKQKILKTVNQDLSKPKFLDIR